MDNNRKKDLALKKGLTKAKSKLAKKSLREIKTRPKQSKSRRILKKDNLLTKRKLFRKLKVLTKDLYYISETDADIFPFIGDKQKNLNSKTLLEQINQDLDTKVEEVNFEDFFRNLITLQDWFSHERIKMAKNFKKIKKLLQNNLRDLKVFKVGKIELDIYVVGLDKRNNLIGIKTKAIET